MRIELRDGQWAELRERINHGQDKVLKRALRRGMEDKDLRPDLDTALVREFATAWSVRDLDGVPITLADEDAIDRAPDDIIDELSTAAWEAWTGATVPNVPTPPSSDASPSAT